MKKKTSISIDSDNYDMIVEILSRVNARFSTFVNNGLSMWLSEFKKNNYSLDDIKQMDSDYVLNLFIRSFLKDCDNILKITEKTDNNYRIVLNIVYGVDNKNYD